MNLTLFWNSMLLGGGVVLLACAMGMLAGLGLVFWRPRVRGTVLAASAMVLAMPSFWAANYWGSVAGQGGWLQPWWPGSVFSMAGSVWVLALGLWPITALALAAAWRGLEAGLVEAEPDMTRLALLRWLLWPAARGPLAGSAVLTFALALNNLSVPALLQTTVYPVAVWMRINTTLDYTGALGVAAPWIAVPALAMAWIAAAGSGLAWPAPKRAVDTDAWRRRFGAWTLAGAGAGTGLLLTAAVLAPLGWVLASERTWSELGSAWSASGNAATGSAAYAGLGAAVALLLGRLIVNYRSLLWAAAGVFLAPGLLAGAGCVFLLSHEWLGWLYPGHGVVVALLGVRYAVIGAGAWWLAHRRVDPALTDVVRLEGGGAIARSAHVLAPASGRVLAAGWLIVFVLALGDVESVLLVLPPGSETLALRAFNFLHYGHHAHVNALCLGLVALALAPIAFWPVLRALARGLVRRFAACGWRSRVVLAVFLLPGAASVSCARVEEPAFESRLFERVELLGARGAGPGQFVKPRSVAVDDRDRVYVMDMTGRVQRFGSDGQLLGSWQMPETDRGRPKGMDRDLGGGVLVVEPHYARVSHFDAAGGLVCQWGTMGTNMGALTFPRAVATTSRGEVWVSEFGPMERIQKFTRCGSNVVMCVGRAGAGPGEFNRAEGVAVDREDRLYVADSCNHRVQVFSADGTFLRAYGGPGSGPGQMSYPYDVRVDAAGYQFVCEFGNSRVQVFDGDGKLVEVLGRAGRRPGQFANPWSVALDSKGNLYVADSQNHRVQRFVRRAAAVPSGS